MKKILLIEDNLEMRENTAEILELANYEVITAANGKEGIKLARTENPDMILCDIMMPEMDGYGVLYILGKDPKTAGVPFIFLTAKADKSDVRKGMNLGADDYLTKPFEEMELLDAIESRFKRSEIIRQEFGEDLEGLTAFINEARGIEVLRELSADRILRKYKRKETIFYEEEYPAYLYFIVSGKVKAWKMNEFGKELITELFKPGDFLGYMPLLQEGPYTETATALETTEVALIPKEDFLNLLKANRDVAYRFIKMLANNVQENEDRLLRLAYSSVRERVAEALLLLINRYQDSEDDQFRMRISREDLAGIVGTAKESLIRTLSDFKTENLVEVEGREIVILDRKGLEKVSQMY